MWTLTSWCPIWRNSQAICLLRLKSRYGVGWCRCIDRIWSNQLQCMFTLRWFRYIIIYFLSLYSARPCWRRCRRKKSWMTLIRTKSTRRPKQQVSFLSPSKILLSISWYLVSSWHKSQWCQAWALIEGGLQRSLGSYICNRTGRTPLARSGP